MPLNELILINDKFLHPYLNFVKEHKYKNDLIYQEIVDTIIESVQSLENFEKGTDCPIKFVIKMND